MYGGVGNYRAYKPTYVKKTPAQRALAIQMAGAAQSAAGYRSRPGYKFVNRTPGAMGIGEAKYFDCEIRDSAIAAVTTTWVAGTMKDPGTTINLGAAAVPTPLCLFAPTVGSGLNQRVGRSVSVRKIKVRGQLLVPTQSAQSTADSSTTVRLLLVVDQQTNSAQMTGAQLLQDTSGADATIVSYQNPNNFGRFKVLKDKSFDMSNLNMANDTGATGGLVQAGIARSFKWNIVFKKPIKVTFNATNGGTVADIIDNSFHIVAGASNTAYAPSISYYTRVMYKDV